MMVLKAFHPLVHIPVTKEQLKTVDAEVERIMMKEIEQRMSKTGKVEKSMFT